MHYKEYKSFKAGETPILVQPENKEELSHALRVLSEHSIKHLVIGNGTNLLVKDTGYQGVILRIGEAFQEINVIGEHI